MVCAIDDGDYRVPELYCLPQATVGKCYRVEECHVAGLGQCAWSRSIKGSQIVMLLVIFLKLPGLVVVGTVRACMCNCAVSLGNFNSRTPSHCDVA